jgi:hypothetical protein
MKKVIAVTLGCAFAVCAQDSNDPEWLRKQKLAAEKAAPTYTGDFVYIGGQMFNSNPVKGQPYSAEAVNETTQVLADGNKIVNRTSSMIYRDSEGRERREQAIKSLGTLNSGSAAKVVFISDPVAKTNYSLRTESRTAEKMPMLVPDGGAGYAFTAQTITSGDRTVMIQPAEPVARAAVRLGPGDGKVEHLGTQVIEGIAAEGTRTTTTIPAGQIGNEREINIVAERWYSQELGVVVMSKRSDPRTGETMYKLTNVNRAEPPHSLFEVPSDYTVVSSGSQKVRVRQEEQ